MVAFHTFALLIALAGAGEPVLLDFYADGCAPCQSMEPAIRRLIAEGYTIRRVNLGQEPQAARQFGVDRVPTLVLLANGREVKRVVGATGYPQLKEMFEAAAPNVKPAGFTSAAGTPPPVPINVAPPEAGASQKQALEATVRLVIEDAKGRSVGTGTIIDTCGDEALVMTCGHIFRDSQGRGPVTVQLFAPGAPAPVRGEVIHFDLPQDIGLVAIRPGMKVTAIRVAPDGYQVRRGDRVFSIGCDHGAAPTVRDSHVIGLNRYVGAPNIEVAGQPVIGRSGGGLFSAEGQLIGVCNLANPEDNEGIYAALSLLHGNLDKIGQSRIYRSASTAIADAERSRIPPRNDFAAPPPPSMPPQMPRSPTEPPRLAIVPQTARPVASPPAVAEPNNSPDDTEVICIVRSRRNPQAPSEVLLLDRPSRELLDRLASETRQRRATDPTVLQAMGTRTAATGEAPDRWANGSSPVVRGQTGQ